MSIIINRPRRLRGSEAIRKLSRETRMSPSSLTYPIFVDETLKGKNPIASLDGQFHYGIDSITEAIDECIDAGVLSCLLFGLPAMKDEIGSSAWQSDGAVQQAIRVIKSKHPNFLVMTDLCLCEYTSHGHCGVLSGDCVNNDKTLPLLQKVALSHAEAGADVIAPSDMMDGRVGAIRTALDLEGYSEIPIMSYAAKYASYFYGPFREAAGSAPAFGDRRDYQMDAHNRLEALKETELDIVEGADIVMVKPALAYLDIIREVRDYVNLPLAAYSVSGEYAMIKAAAKADLIDEYGVMCESAVSIYRAGADILISYFAKELGCAIKKGDIG